MCSCFFLRCFPTAKRGVITVLPRNCRKKCCWIIDHQIKPLPCNADNTKATKSNLHCPYHFCGDVVIISHPGARQMWRNNDTYSARHHIYNYSSLPLAVSRSYSKTLGEQTCTLKASISIIRTYSSQNVDRILEPSRCRQTGRKRLKLSICKTRPCWKWFKYVVLYDLLLEKSHHIYDLTLKKANEAGVDESVTKKFPGSEVIYGSAASGAGDNREIPLSEGGGLDPKTGRYVWIIVYRDRLIHRN
jgi:hypothetical protein